MMIATTLARFAIAAILAVALAGCSSTRLADGLTQRMDSSTAQLNTADAIGIINHYRSTQGVGALMEDPSLSAQAKMMAANYAKTGRQASKPEGTSEIRYSAGYSTFAETFSGWRNSAADAAALVDKGATKAGVASVYDANSPYGVYWVLILG